MNAGRRILLVGATGILRPAVTTLVGRGEPVTALARTRRDLEHLQAAHPDAIDIVAVDYTDELAMAAELAGLYRAGVVYAPAGTARTWSILRSTVEGTLVEVVTSAAAAPTPGVNEPFDLESLAAPGPRWNRLLLGWRADRSWHSPEEVSAAALEVLATGRDAQLGAVRPWSDRPV